MTYQAKQFSLPELPGISTKQIEIHLGLYQGYVMHVNLLYEEIEKLEKSDLESKIHIIQELKRRLGFEFDGMRLHEFYFGDLEGGAQQLSPDSNLAQALMTQYGSLESVLDTLKKTASRGSGWVILNYDPAAKVFHSNWVENHHIGQLATLPVVVALDAWEHAYMVDYVPADRPKYIESYLQNLNWDTIAKRFETLAS